MPFLAGRHQKTSPKFLASVEFHNVMSRCLARVQAKRSKVYVYINELCTVFKAHSQKKQQQQQQLASAPDAASPSQPPGPQAEAPKARGSKRHIRYLEKLLQVHAKEIRRLQEKELDLEEMESEDSAYMQESRLKRHMMRIFKRLCELKDCNSLTGRVIEQRIPYRGTRYPEVNRRIERLVNQSEAFPDYSDILKVVQKASIRHNLALPKCQMERMAADAFREVGNRLQERRQMDLVYNFGCHLTDQYQPSKSTGMGQHLPLVGKVCGPAVRERPGLPRRKRRVGLLEQDPAVGVELLLNRGAACGTGAKRFKPSTGLLGWLRAP